MNEVGKQLKKGVIEILILELLCEAKMYGYQLLQELDSRSDGVFRMKEGTLYPVLYRLEDSKYIESYWEQDIDKRGLPRKYYKITGTGHSALKSMKQELDTLIKAIKSILKEGY